MHGLKRRVDANSLSLFSQPPFGKPGIVFSTFGKLILKEPVVCKTENKPDSKNRARQRERKREKEREVGGIKTLKRGRKEKRLPLKELVLQMCFL